MSEDNKGSVPPKQKLRQQWGRMTDAERMAVQAIMLDLGQFTGRMLDEHGAKAVCTAFANIAAVVAATDGADRSDWDRTTALVWDMTQTLTAAMAADGIRPEGGHP
jgi:uncharacterized protein with von Willebrand factor type A (vWA) domain